MKTWQSLMLDMAARHRKYAEQARALGQEASARSSDEAADMLEREVRDSGWTKPSEETPLSTPKVLL